MYGTLFLLGASFLGGGLMWRDMRQRQKRRDFQARMSMPYGLGRAPYNPFLPDPSSRKPKVAQSFLGQHNDENLRKDWDKMTKPIFGSRN